MPPSKGGGIFFVVWTSLSLQLPHTHACFVHRYVFNREVMEVFSALNNMMRGKDPWTVKKMPPPPPPPPAA